VGISHLALQSLEGILRGDTIPSQTGATHPAHTDVTDPRNQKSMTSLVELTEIKAIFWRMRQDCYTVRRSRFMAAIEMASEPAVPLL
jgi:hypothetical protein